MTMKTKVDPDIIRMLETAAGEAALKIVIGEFDHEDAWIHARRMIGDARLDELHPDVRTGLYRSYCDDVAGRESMIRTLTTPDGVERLCAEVLLAEADRQARLIPRENVLAAIGDQDASVVATAVRQYRDAWFRFYLNTNVEQRLSYCRRLVRRARQYAVAAL